MGRRGRADAQTMLQERVMTTVSPIPPGFRSVTPHMTIKNAGEAMDFYVKAFGAEEISRFPMPGMDLLAHGLLRVGDSFIMVADEFPPEFCADALSPTTAKGTTVALHIYTEDVDGMYRRALDAGCETVMEPMDAFWGDRYGMVRDPYGHHWGLATHVKDMTPEEMAEAAAAEFAGAPES